MFDESDNDNDTEVNGLKKGFGEKTETGRSPLKLKSSSAEKMGEVEDEGSIEYLLGAKI